MLTTLIGRVPRLVPARIVGWRVIGLPDAVYPGLIRGSELVTGVAISGLTDDEWHVLDAFEDPIYELHLVDLTEGGRAWVYACLTSQSPSDAPWDIDRFARQHLTAYLDRCATWRSRYDASKTA